MPTTPALVQKHRGDAPSKRVLRQLWCTLCRIHGGGSINGHDPHRRCFSACYPRDIKSLWDLISSSGQAPASFSWSLHPSCLTDYWCYRTGLKGETWPPSLLLPSPHEGEPYFPNPDRLNPVLRIALGLCVRHHTVWAVVAGTQNWDP